MVIRELRVNRVYADTRTAEYMRLIEWYVGVNLDKSDSSYVFEYDGMYARIPDKEGKWAVINKDGKYVYAGADKINYLWPVMEIGPAVKDGAVQIFDIEYDGFRVKNTLRGYKDISGFYCFNFAVVTDYLGYKGICDLSGNMLFPAQYTDIYWSRQKFDYGNEDYLTVDFKLYYEDGRCEYKSLSFDVSDNPVFNGQL